MRLTLLGSGCSKGTPKMGCSCASCDLSRVRPSQIRRRFAVLVEECGTLLLFDAGPDIRTQLLAQQVDVSKLDHIFITHDHYDHTAGLGEFYGSGRRTPVNLYGYDIGETIVHKGFGYLVTGGYVKLTELHPHQSLTVGPFRITPVHLCHGVITLGYVVESLKYDKKIVIATDTTSSLPQKTLDALQNSQLMLIDAWADTEETAHRLVEEVYSSNNVETFNYDPARRYHMLFQESVALAAALKTELAVAIHIGHLAPPHSKLTALFQTQSFVVGYDYMQFSLQAHPSLRLNKLEFARGS